MSGLPEGPRTSPDFEFRRTLTAITFCLFGLPLLGLLAWTIHIVRSQAPLVYRLALGLEALLGIVVLGLAMTVALRQISGKLFGNEFSASGRGDQDEPA